MNPERLRAILFAVLLAPVLSGCASTNDTWEYKVVKVEAGREGNGSSTQWVDLEVAAERALNLLAADGWQFVEAEAMSIAEWTEQGVLYLVVRRRRAG